MCENMSYSRSFLKSGSSDAEDEYKFISQRGGRGWGEDPPIFFISVKEHLRQRDYEKKNLMKQRKW